MKEHANRQSEIQDGVESKKVFVKPELRREARLPKVTNAFVGTFNP